MTTIYLIKQIQCSNFKMVVSMVKITVDNFNRYCIFQPSFLNKWKHQLSNIFPKLKFFPLNILVQIPSM